MDLKKYFEGTEGAGFLATCNSSGEVDIAVFAKPHVMSDGAIAFGMADRLTHKNLEENPHAVYAFKENEYKGVRLFLERVKEETWGPMIDQIRKEARDQSPYPEVCSEIKCVEYFRVTQHLPLVNKGEVKESRWAKACYPMPL